MNAGKESKSAADNATTPSTVHFSVAASAEANSHTPASLSGELTKNLPKTSTPYPKDNPDHQLSISRIASGTEQTPDLQHKDGPAAKRRKEVDDDAAVTTNVDNSVVKSRLQARIEEMKRIQSECIEPFSTSERFERFTPVRLNELLKEFLKVEQELKERILIIKKRLNHISCSLQEF